MSEREQDTALAAVETGDPGNSTLRDFHVPLSVSSFGLTDRGRVRETNEDQFLIATLVKALQIQQASFPQATIQHSSDRSHLFIVADGIGGHAAGEQASALAIHSVESFILETFKWFVELEGQEQDAVLADFQNALGQANAEVLTEGAAHAELRGMGTTMTLAYSQNDVLFVAHVGDSRCYLCRCGVLHRLTRDHTLVDAMVRKGVLSPEAAATHRLRHVITNFIGGNAPEVDVEMHKIRLESGDQVLLCSDGLTGEVPDEAILKVLNEAQPEQACRRLVALANDARGADNITAVVARFDVVGA